MSSSTFFAYALRIVACLCVAAAARAETGVTDTTIMIGQSAVFSGSVADTGNHYRSGIELYFNQVNRSGGVNGRKLRLAALDDAYDPQRTVQNTHALIE